MYTLPKGFLLAVANADFRGKNLPRNDLSLVLCEQNATAAGLFTTNLFKAAPVLSSQKILKESKEIRAVVINSGQANACTGEKGMQACLQSQALIEELFSLPKNSVLTASTGVIGAHMDMEKWEEGCYELRNNLGQASLEDYAKSIMTTDAFPKITYKKIEKDGKEVIFAGVAKGAGMICPNMATMLSVLISDVAADKKTWEEVVKNAVHKGFNQVSVDGDTSTNDSLFALTSGLSGVSLEKEELQQIITEMLQELAYLLVKDGEGASKVMHITVTGAKTNADAEKIARTVGHSQLVKTAMFGKDPNWGRIVAAAGRAGVSFDPDGLTLTLCGIEIFKNGQPVDMDIDTVFYPLLDKTDIEINIALKEGEGKAHLKASDLSHDYVSLNSDYRS